MDCNIEEGLHILAVLHLSKEKKKNIEKSLQKWRLFSIDYHFFVIVNIDAWLECIFIHAAALQVIIIWVG